jgi:hypothetical protein
MDATLAKYNMDCPTVTCAAPAKPKGAFATYAFLPFLFAFAFALLEGFPSLSSPV